MDTMYVIAVSISLILVYFIPAIVASHKKHKQQTAICILNLVFGWTVLGWLIALIWACTND